MARHGDGHDDLAACRRPLSSYAMVGLDCAIIMHPQVWKCSGHYDLFHDYMVDCRESKKRYRHDQVRAVGSRPRVSAFSWPFGGRRSGEASRATCVEIL